MVKKVLLSGLPCKECGGTGEAPYTGHFYPECHKCRGYGLRWSVWHAVKARRKAI